MEKKSRIKRIVLTTVAMVIAVPLIFLGGLYIEGRSIPKLYFEGDISGMKSKQDLRSISVRYVGGDMDISGFAELKVQGTSSLKYDKKNYTIKLFSDPAHEDKLKLDLGWGEQNTYCLKANWIDRTHARNVVTARLVSQIQSRYGLLTQAPKNGAVDGFPVEIYVNGGFHGLYTFNIPKDAWQFGMDSDNPNHIVICGEGWKAANLFEAEPDFDTWAVEVGEENEYTLERMNQLFAFVMHASDEEFKADFHNYIDLDAALNYYVMVDFAHLRDNYGKNMLLATYDGVKWYPSLYDLDSSWGTDYTGMDLFAYEESTVPMNRSALFRRMEECFAKELAARYFDLRQDILTEENVMAEFEAFRDDIPTISFMREAKRWSADGSCSSENLPGYDYDQIEAYLDTTVKMLDEKYEAMRGE